MASGASGAGALSPLASPTATRDVLDRHGLRLKKSLGQNFLVNDAIVGKILQLAEVSEDDVVLEVGPGIGTLTYALLSRAKAVISIERDPALPDVLADTLSGFDGRFAFVGKDALDVSAADIEQAAASIGAPFPNKMVANLPYAVAATIVLDYFQRFGDEQGTGTCSSGIESMTAMVQREVAERMTAKPGTKSYGAYTVKLAMYARAEGSFSVSPNNFMPPPHVESTVIRLDFAPASDDPVLVRAACTMADAAFFARRKTIANSCKQYFASRGANISDCLADIFEAAGVSPAVRGETLAPETYLALGSAYAERVQHV